MRKKRRYAMPTDIHSTSEARSLVVFAIIVLIIFASLAAAHILLSSTLGCTSESTMVMKP